MSTTLPAPFRPAMPSRLARAPSTARLAAIAARAIATIILQRAARQALRELALLNNRAP